MRYLHQINYIDLPKINTFLLKVEIIHITHSDLTTTVGSDLMSRPEMMIIEGEHEPLLGSLHLVDSTFYCLGLLTLDILVSSTVEGTTGGDSSLLFLVGLTVNQGESLPLLGGDLSVGDKIEFESASLVDDQQSVVGHFQPVWTILNRGRRKEEGSSSVTTLSLDAELVTTSDSMQSQRNHSVLIFRYSI